MWNNFVCFWTVFNRSPAEHACETQTGFPVGYPDRFLDAPCEAIPSPKSFSWPKYITVDGYIDYICCSHKSTEQKYLCRQTDGKPN